MSYIRPMFPPVADSARAFSRQCATGLPASETLTGDSPKPAEALDLAQLRFVRCLVRCGATVEQTIAIVAAELERARSPRRRLHFTLSGRRV